MPLSRKVKFAILSYGSTLESFQFIAVTKLLDITALELDAVIETGRTHRSKARRFWNSFRIPARKSLDISGLFTGSTRIAAQDFAAIQSRGLDFILNFTTGQAPGEILAWVSAGVWSFRHGIDAPEEMRGFWEIYRGHHSISSRLERGDGTVLGECIVATDRTSYARTIDALLTAASELPARAAKNLLIEKTLPSQPDPLPSGGIPNFFEPALARVKQSGRWAKLQADSIFFWENWGVGVVDATIHKFLDPHFQPNVRWLPISESLRFIADPFAIADDAGLRVFVEEFDYERYQGYISAFDVPTGKPSTIPQVLIDEGVHMSYPFLVPHRGQLYCIPEMCRNYEVRLYRHEPLQNAWKKEATIIAKFPAVDSTILEYQGRWWLFCSSSDDYPDAKLYIWYASDLFGPWRQHWMNPVKCDISSSRPGGTPFFHESILYRPAQDSSKGYGGAVCINRVTCLTPNDFAEEVVMRIGPLQNGPYPEGIHTLSTAGSYTVIDGKRTVFLAPLLKKKLAHKLKRLRQTVTGH